MPVEPRPTLLHHFQEYALSRQDDGCVFLNRGGAQVTKTWGELARDAARCSAALQSLRAGHGDRVALASANRYEWVVADLAILGLGAVNVPLHNSLTGPQLRFQIVDAGAKVLLVAGDEQLAKLATDPSFDPGAVRIVSFDVTTVRLGERPIPRLEELAPPADDGAVRAWFGAALAHVGADDLATILYTSGTTGEPKGVMLTHGNLATNAEGCVEAFGSIRAETGLIDRRLNLLPLSHIFARTCDLYCWIVGGTELALAASPQTAVAECATLQPTLLNAVPYFYERVMRALVENGFADAPAALQKLLGGRVRHCCSGGAPLPAHIARFFCDRGLTLSQGYGLTETSPVITMNTPKVHKHGTVGRPLPGVEVRFADDGEILTRGPHVMSGYWNRPAETAAALEGGWFHTGDIGEFDADGFLKITGRKKELIVTSGGKKVVPAAIEALLAGDPLVKQAVVVGDGRIYLAALLVCDAELLAEVAQQAGLGVTSDTMWRDPRVADLVVERLRPRLANVSHYEQVQKAALVDREFSIDRGELTLTMKLRRSRIAENFAAEIERLYSTDGHAAREAS